MNPHFHLDESLRDFPILVITHPLATARVALQGAHLMEWTPTGEEPVLYLSPDAFLQPGKPIRGGVPLCWPWFGTPADAALPAHGCVRTRPWQLCSTVDDDDGMTLIFRLEQNAATLDLWPHEFALELTLKIGSALEMALQMTNTSTAPVQLTSALHTYFAVGHISQASVSGLDAASYMDTVGPHTVRTQQGDIHFTQEVDRIYASGNAVQIQDRQLQRTISITSSGSKTSVVWNPWIDKSKRLADLPDAGYQHFLCVETAFAWKEAVTLAPGGVHTLSARIKVTH